MRYLTCALSLGAALLAAGCADSKWAFIHNNREDTRALADNPKAADLVGYLNQNAQRIQTLECPNLDLDIKQGFQQWGMRGKMICDKPRNFRMVAEVLAKNEADIGSNKDEFWYWIARDNPPYLVHCSYANLERGVKIPFPFQPEWVMEALGMGTYDPGLHYQVIPHRNTLDLVCETVNQGQRVQKITVFNRSASRTQVREHVLRDASGREICKASVLDAQNIQGVMVPQVIVLSYPAEKLELKMKLYTSGRDVVVNRPLDPNQAAALFTRPRLVGVRTYDLATRALDDGGEQLRQAGGLLQQR
jgi:hypothetical protein